MTTTQSHFAVFTASTIGLLAGAASAQLHEGDIFPEIIDGQFVTQSDLYLGAFAHPGGPFGRHGYTDDPGYNAHYDSMYNGDVLYYEVVTDLYYWSPDDGGFASSSRTVTIDRPLGSAIIGQSAVTNPTNAIDIISGGSLHAHIDMILSDVSGSSVVSDAIGFYGFQLSLYSLEGVGGASTGIEASDPFWMVLGYGVSDSTLIDAALADFRAVPAPTTSSLCLAFAGAMACRRRRAA